MIFFDIETLPTNDEQVIADLAAGIKPPAQYKKQESIDQWMAENRDIALAELIAKTSFSGMHGRVACISWAYSDDAVCATAKEMSEEDSIRLFFEDIEENFNTSLTQMCGHNIKAFDLQFLKHRSIILGIRPPRCVHHAMNCSIYDDFINDTMFMWTGDRNKYVSLDALCRAFGIEGKGDFDGSMVAETWDLNPQKVIDYCKSDVLKTREVYNRMTFKWN